MKNIKNIILKTLLAVSLCSFLFFTYKALPYFGSFLPTTGKAGKVQVKKTPDGWRMFASGQPFFIKGVCYQYVPVGKGNTCDIFTIKDKPWITDGKLMKNMGINAVRFYKCSKDEEQVKQVVNDLYSKFGIRTALGHYLGYWDYPPPNYALPKVRERIKNEVLDMVNKYKDEGGILFWILGNENNYAFDRGIRDWSTPEIDEMESPLAMREAKAKIYYSFVNELAGEIKKIDPNHPVVMGNGELTSIYVAKDICDNVDILGGIVYQGKTFGTYFKRLERNFNKPNVFIEFGADRYDASKQEEAQDWQAFFLKLQWLEIYNNRAGGSGNGNSLGGFIFEWCDEWWKNNPANPKQWGVHNTEASWSNTAYYFDSKARNNMNEEWYGVVGIDSQDRSAGIEKRVPKKSYYVLQSLWAKEYVESKKTALFSGIFFVLTLGLAFAVIKTKK